MTNKKRIMAVVALLFLFVEDCGGLRYSEVSPEALNFHPRRIAALPADIKAFAEAKGDVDRLFAEVLNERKWFDVVIGGGDLRRRMESDEAFRQVVTDYLAKRSHLGFSDPVLSGKLGRLTEAEALLLVRVDYWNYTTEKDKKIAKVSLSIEMVEAQTGKILWMAAHQKASDYVLIKPDLRDVARAVIREMIGHMPH